jgi:hypothetical protein
MDLTLIAFDDPAEVRTFEKGRFEVYAVGLVLSGRAAVNMDDGGYALK